MAENIGVDERAAPAVAAAPRVDFRRATEADCQLLWEWCNDPVVRGHSFSSDPITFGEHRRWFGRKLVDPRCVFLIAVVDGRPIGQARYDLGDGEAVVSVSVDVAFRGFGYGSDMIRRSADVVFADTDIHFIRAYIMSDNHASIRAFEMAGYQRIGTAMVEGKNTLHFVRERER